MTAMVFADNWRKIKTTFDIQVFSSFHPVSEWNSWNMQSCSLSTVNSILKRVQ